MEDAFRSLRKAKYQGERLDQDHSVDWLMRCNTVTITGFFFTFPSVLASFAIPFSSLFCFLSRDPPARTSRHISLRVIFIEFPTRSRPIRRLHLVTRNYPRAQLDVSIYDIPMRNTHIDFNYEKS